MNRRFALLVVLALVGCVEKDKTAPPPPNVDPIVTPTAATHLMVTGSAEYASKVSISGGVQAVEVEADHFTARFRAEVEIQPNQSTTLVFTATDAAGNSSGSTNVVVENKPPMPAALSLRPSREEVRAGELVKLGVEVVDQYGEPLQDAQVSFEVNPPLAGTFTLPGSSPPVVKDQGVVPGTRQFVAYELAQAAAGQYAFQVRAFVAGTEVQDTATITVRPAAGARLSSFHFLPSGNALSVSAGAEPQYAYQVVDLFGNDTIGPVASFINAPGATVVDDGVSGTGRIINLIATGNFTLNAYITGAGLGGTLQLAVGTAAPAAINLTASASLIAPQTDLKAFADVRDLFGNRIACTTATAADVQFAAQGNLGNSVSPQAVACFNGAFEATFRFSVEDVYSVSASYAPGGSASGVTSNVFVTVLGFDNTPPTISIAPSAITVNGVPCSFSGTPAACAVLPGDVIEFVVTANDNSGRLSELNYSAFFTTAPNNSALRTRTMFIASDATLPVSQVFWFTVPNAFLEDVPLVAMAVDAAGNRATSMELLLRVAPFPTYNGRVASLVVRDVGGIVNGPEDVVVAPNGDLFIANEGNSNILKLAAGAQVPTVFASSGSLSAAFGGGFNPRFMTQDGAGNLYVTDSGGSSSVLQIAPAQAVTEYLRYNNAANLWGLSTANASSAKGLITPANAQDGDRVTVGSVVYELDTNGACAGTNACIDLTGGSGNSAVAAALAGCINSGSGCTMGIPGGTAVSPNAGASATVSSTPTSMVVLTAKIAGAAGNTVAFSTNACPRLVLNYNASCAGTVASLDGGQDASFFVGQEQGGSTIDTIFRFPFSFTTGFPRSQGNAVGAYDMTVTAVDHEQWGLAARNLSTASSRNLQDWIFYYPDMTIGSDRLRASRSIEGVASAAFNSTAIGGGRPGCNDCIRGTNDSGVPLRTFSRLWDVVSDSNGCLLVSDDGNGSIYAVDARNAATADPSVTLVARGLFNPRGVDLGPDGSLYVAVQNSDAIVKIAPSPSTTDCF